MAELVHFYRGGLTPSEFKRLSSGEYLALVSYRDRWVEEAKRG